MERGEFFRWCSALERQRESLIVVGGLPRAEGGRGDVEILEAVSPPELLLIDSVAPLDVAVLLGAPAANVPIADPRRFDREDEGERKPLQVIALQAFDGEGKGLLQVREEREARAVVQPSVQP